MNNEDLIHFLDRVAMNAPGRYFVTDHCRHCGQCYDSAPEFFRPDTTTGRSYVYRQPSGADEESRCREAMENCPTQSIYDLGLAFDWKKHPPREGDINRAA